MLGLLHITNHTRAHTHLQHLLLGSKPPKTMEQCVIYLSLQAD